MLVSTALYVVAWQRGNRRSARKEAERIEALKVSGWLKEKMPEGVDSERIEVQGAGGDVVTELKI